MNEKGFRKSCLRLGINSLEKNAKEKQSEVRKLSQRSVYLMLANKSKLLQYLARSKSSKLLKTSATRHLI